jgi:hypothetical protein
MQLVATAIQEDASAIVSDLSGNAEADIIAGLIRQDAADVRVFSIRADPASILAQLDHPADGVTSPHEGP